MLVKVPASINVARLVDALNTSPTKATNLKHKIYYFLSLITDTNDNYRLNDENGGYHKLCSAELKKALGSKDFYVIRDLVMNPADPIIEVDNSWHIPMAEIPAATVKVIGLPPNTIQVKLCSKPYQINYQN